MRSKWSKAAQTKSKNAEVKALAAMLVKDHTKTTTELKAWAAASPSFTLPPSAPADVQASIYNIKNATADAGFDDKYLDTVIDAHEDRSNSLANTRRTATMIPEAMGGRRRADAEGAFRPSQRAAREAE